MQDGKGQLQLPSPSRPWRDIARELGAETNRKKAIELSQELSGAFEEQKGAAATRQEHGDASQPLTLPKP